LLRDLGGRVAGVAESVEEVEQLVLALAEHVAVADAGAPPGERHVEARGGPRLERPLQGAAPLPFQLGEPALDEVERPAGGLALGGRQVAQGREAAGDDAALAAEQPGVPLLEGGEV